MRSNYEDDDDDDDFEEDEQDFDIMTDEETTDADHEEHHDVIHPDMVTSSLYIFLIVPNVIYIATIWSKSSAISTI